MVDIDKETSPLWHTADQFRTQVCEKLANLNENERASLRGDYLFVIDEQPRFVLVVEAGRAWSTSLKSSEAFELQSRHASEILTEHDVRVLVSGGARASVQTDSLTLHRVLTGALKARVAFVTGKVSVRGDLPAFLKMVSLLKLQGVRPLSKPARLSSLLEEGSCGSQ